MNSFTDYYYRNYVTSTFSFTQFLCLFIYYLIIAVPFYFSFFDNNFWLQPKHNIMLAQIANTGLYALQVRSSSGNQYYSNIPGIPSTMSNLQLAQVSIQDHQNLTQIVISLNSFDAKTISSINFITFYNASVPIIDRKVSTALQFAYQGNVQGVNSTGMISFQQNKPLEALNEFKNANQPLYYPNFAAPKTFDALATNVYNSPFRIKKQLVESILTQSSNSQVTNLATRTLRFSLTKDIVIPITYYPSILQTLKFRFLRFFAFFLITYFFLRWFLLLNLKQQTLDSNIHDDVPKKWK